MPDTSKLHIVPIPADPAITTDASGDWVGETAQEHTVPMPADPVVTTDATGDWVGEADQEHLVPIPADPVATNYFGSPVVVSSALSRDDDSSDTDETTEANNATINDMNLLPSGAAINDGYLIGSGSPWDALKLNVGTAGAGTWTIVWTYWNGSTWADLTVIDDEINDFKTVRDDLILNFERPDDWASVSILGGNYFWIFGQAQTFSSMSVQPLGTQAWVMRFTESSSSASFSSSSFSSSSFSSNSSSSSSSESSGSSSSSSSESSGSSSSSSSESSGSSSSSSSESSISSESSSSSSSESSISSESSSSSSSESSISSESSSSSSSESSISSESSSSSSSESSGSSSSSSSESSISSESSSSSSSESSISSESSSSSSSESSISSESSSSSSSESSISSESSSSSSSESSISSESSSSSSSESSSSSSSESSSSSSSESSSSSSSESSISSSSSSSGSQLVYQGSWQQEYRQGAWQIQSSSSSSESSASSSSSSSESSASSSSSSSESSASSSSSSSDSSESSSSSSSDSSSSSSSESSISSDSSSSSSSFSSASSVSSSSSCSSVSGSLSISSSSSLSRSTDEQNAAFNAIPDWFWWGPRADMEFDLRSGPDLVPDTRQTLDIISDTNDGAIYDGTAAWDGTGDGINAGGDWNTVGNWWVGVAEKYTSRVFQKFDISAIPDNAVIQSARLLLYYMYSLGDEVAQAAPDSSDVGYVLIDHIEDWGGALVVSDYQQVAKTSDIGTLVPNDRTPGQWMDLDVTSYVQADLDEADVSDTSCFRLRQSLDETYIQCSESNLWQFNSANNTVARPHLLITYTVPDSNWNDWDTAYDNKLFSSELERYVQNRFYAWVPQDVRDSRDTSQLPEFIYRTFVLKWWGERFRYAYRYRDDIYPSGPSHVWGYTQISWGQYRFGNSAIVSPTLYDELPVFEV